MMEQEVESIAGNSGENIAVEPRAIIWLELHSCDTSLSTLSLI